MVGVIILHIGAKDFSKIVKILDDGTKVKGDE